MKSYDDVFILHHPVDNAMRINMSHSTSIQHPKNWNVKMTLYAFWEYT